MQVKRTVYLVNPKFQLKFSLFVCSLVFISSLIYPLTIYELFEKILREANITAPNSEIADFRSGLISTLVIYQLAFTAMVFIVCIFQSHKIAGPITKTVNYLKEIARGKIPTKISFRLGDNFQELSTELNNAFNKIHEEQDKDYAYISEINSYLNNLALVVPEDKKSVLNEIIGRLSEIQERFKK